MACKNVCRLCPRLAISASVTFTGGNLVVNLPTNSYRNGEKVCIVIAQTIPAETTLTAPVVITLGDGTVQYPLTTKCCAQVTAADVSTRTKYCTCVRTSATSGTFRLLGNICCRNNNLTSIDGTAPAAPAAPAT